MIYVKIKCIGVAHTLTSPAYTSYQVVLLRKNCTMLAEYQSYILRSWIPIQKYYRRMSNPIVLITLISSYHFQGIMLMQLSLQA